MEMVEKKDGANPTAMQNPGDASPDAGSPAPAPPPAHPATTGQKFILSIVLVAVTLAVIWIGHGAISLVEEFLQRENRAEWIAPADVGIKPGPTSFWYDASKRQLVHIGVIDPKRKLELIALFPAESSESAKQHLHTYWTAVDKLAFSSNQRLGGLIVGLLFLGGIAGVLGVQLRSLVNFVGHACYTRSLDLVIWWPYYALRPFIGFILGVVVVIIIHAGFFVANGAAPSGTLWWAGIAFLAGFGEQEFTQKLRQLTKTLFGEGK